MAAALASHLHPVSPVCPNAGAGQPLAGATAGVCPGQQGAAAAAADAAEAAAADGASTNPLQALLGVARAATPDNVVRAAADMNVREKHDAHFCSVAPHR